MVETQMMPENKTLLNDALDYLQKGLTVIPIRGWSYGLNYDDSKRPLIKTWRKWQGKKPTENIIRDWFQQKPNMNLGLLTGPYYDLLVVDIDRQHGGYESLSDKELPNTWISCTKNGEQYMYKWDPRLNDVSTTLVGFMPGVDTRGRGGYVVAPPSKIYGEDGKCYQWKEGHSPETNELAPPPEWLVAALLERGSHEKEYSNAPTVYGNWLDEVKDGVAQGENRHKAMTRLASFYMSRGLPEDDVIALMLIWNKKCQPPREETEFLFKLNDFLENWRTGKYKSRYQPTQGKLSPQSSENFLGTEEIKIEWLVQDLIPQESLTFLYGYQGTGKSLLALDLAIEIGRGGGNWMNHFPVKGGKVLYLDEESHPTLLKSRYSRMLGAKNLDMGEVDVSFLNQQQIKLDNEESVDALKGLLVEMRPSLVVVDSFSAVHSLNEISSIDMGKMRDYLKSIMIDCKCGILFIDHEGQPSMVWKTAAQRQRGNSTKGDMADCKLLLSEVNKRLVVEHAKPRWGLKQPPFNVELQGPMNGPIVVQYMGEAQDA